MPAEIIVVIVVCLLAATVVLVLARIEGSITTKPLLISIGALVACILWVSLSKYPEEPIVNVYDSATINNVDILVFKLDRETKLINLNEELEMDVPENSKIRVQYTDPFYNNGIYYGRSIVSYSIVEE